MKWLQEVKIVPPPPLQLLDGSVALLDRAAAPAEVAVRGQSELQMMQLGRKADEEEDDGADENVAEAPGARGRPCCCWLASTSAAF
jgi:hypothetical protein